MHQEYQFDVPSGKSEGREQCGHNGQLCVDQPIPCHNASDRAAVVVIVANTSKSLKPYAMAFSSNR